MDTSQVNNALAIYESLLQELGLDPEEFEHTKILQDPNKALNHAYSMLDQISEHMDAGRYGKTMRWLGFVQGVFFTTGQFSIENLKDHNKPVL